MGDVPTPSPSLIPLHAISHSPIPASVLERCRHGKKMCLLSARGEEWGLSDNRQRPLTIGMRVVSLLPSATEIVALLNPGTLVGRSHECDFPVTDSVRSAQVLSASRIAPTTSPPTTSAPSNSAQIDAEVRAALASGASLYTLDVDLLRSLAPDLIITQDLCEVCSIDLLAVERVARDIVPRPRVISLNPASIEGVLDDIHTIGLALGLERHAREIVVRLRDRMFQAEEFVNPYTDKPSVAFLEWTDPIYVGGHWTPQLIERAGGVHPLNPTVAIPNSGAAAGPVGATQRAAGKSLRVSAEDLIASQPDHIVICPCGVSLDRARREADGLAQHAWWRELPAVVAGKVAIVDGNQMFNRPGPRLVDAFEFLVGWINDRVEMIPKDFPWKAMSR